MDKQNSTFAQHLIDNNHNMADINKGLEVLHVCQKGNRLDMLEQFEIYKCFKNEEENKFVLNEKLHFQSNYIFNAILQRTYRPKSADNQQDKNS